MGLLILAPSGRVNGDLEGVDPLHFDHVGGLFHYSLDDSSSDGRTSFLLPRVLFWLHLRSSTLCYVFLFNTKRISASLIFILIDFFLGGLQVRGIQDGTGCPKEQVQNLRSGGPVKGLSSIQFCCWMLRARRLQNEGAAHSAL